MYTYVRSVALSRSMGSQWDDIDLRSIIVYDIYNSYNKVYLVLSHPALPNEVYVDFDVLKYEYSAYKGTLNDVLTAIGSRALPTVIDLPSTKIKVAKYSDAFRAEYKVDVTTVGGGSISTLADLVLTRPKYHTDMSLIHDYCLVSVNGYYHLTDTDGTKAYVYKGGDTLKKSKHNQLGILSFLDIGKLTKVRLNKDDINPQSINGLLKDKITFSISQDITDKSYFLVLGGYLVFPDDGVFWFSGDKSFTLDLTKLPHLERLVESRMYMDMSSLELLSNEINPDLINIDDAWSDEVIKRYLTMYQTFLVIVDTPNLITNKVYIRHSSLPGMFTSYQEPTTPLIVGYGKVAEYWKTNEDDHWAVNVLDSYYRNYLISNQPTSSLKNITDHTTPVSTFYNSRGFLLEITGYNSTL